MRLRPETLEMYIRLARTRLIALAKQGKTITYRELMQEMGGPGRGYIKQVLQRVCQGEYEQGRPLLGSLVVLAHGGHPGNGYWESQMARKTIGSKSSKQAKIEFWQRERQKVYDYWQKHNFQG